MNKSQAIHNFWSGFGLKAYDETTVPNKEFTPEFPYITYRVVMDDLDSPIVLTASLWDRSTSWKTISDKVEEISEAITKMNPPAIEIDNGRLYITKGSPFAQRMRDPDDSIRRIYINLQAEFLTAY